MELTDIRIFITIAEEGTATRAAKRLAMTQPGVSQHLASLEKDIGQELFERRAKRLVLSDFGRVFLGRAKKLLEDAEELRNLAAETALPKGTLKLGLTDAATQTVIPPALAKFRGRYPRVKLKLDVDDSKDIEESVLRGHYDLGVIASGMHSHPLLEEEELYHDRIDAIVSKKHPLAGRRRISLEILAEQTLLIYPRRSRARRMIDEEFHKDGIIPKEIIDVYMNTAAVRLAEAGIGVALLPEEFISDEMPKRRCVHLRISGDPFERTISLVRKRGAHLSDAAAMFYEILMEDIRS